MDILNTFRRTQPILRADTPDHFRNEVAPVLYTGIMKGWPAYPKWNLNYLAEHFGHCKISADRKMDGHTSYIYSDIASYVEYIQTTTDETPFYGKTIIHLYNEMKQEYQAPEQFRCWYRDFHQLQGIPRPVDLSCIYFGPRGSRTNLHYDIWSTSFWNALFEGRKLWLFFPVNQEHLLYNGEVDPLAVDTHRFPLFAEAEPITCIQEPGEFIYCPGNIYHWAYALEPCVALSENFINQENYRMVLKYLYNSGFTKAAQKMEDIVQLFLNQPA